MSDAPRPEPRTRRRGELAPELTWETVTPTGQQGDRLVDGIHLVFELLARRYRKEHPPGNPSEAVRESP